MDGKTIRLNRLFKNNKMLCVPLDHGITLKDIAQLSDFKKTVSSIIDSGATAIIIHKGMVKFLPNLKKTGLIIHLSASTQNIVPVKKVIVCEVEEAISLGADAVSIHVNLGNDYEKSMLEDFARISKDCQKYGMPLLAMMYIRNNNNEDISNKEMEKHSIRIATELGADIVKIGPNYNKEQLDYVIKDSLIPVIVAGGELMDSETFYKRTKELIKSDIKGFSFGRNVFMSPNPEKVTYELAKILFD